MEIWSETDQKIGLMYCRSIPNDLIQQFEPAGSEHSGEVISPSALFIPYGAGLDIRTNFDHLIRIYKYNYYIFQHCNIYCNLLLTSRT